MAQKSNPTSVQVRKTFRVHLENGGHTLSFNNESDSDVNRVRLSVFGSEVIPTAGEKGIPQMLSIDTLKQLRDLCDTGIRVWEEQTAQGRK